MSTRPHPVERPHLVERPDAASLRAAFAVPPAAPPRRQPTTPDFSADDLAAHAGRPLRPAAVLAGIVLREDEPAVLLTLRNERMRSHAGQISFPGGSIDASDRSPAAAALREAHEEVGLDSAAVEVLGELDPHVTASGFHIHPVVGLIHPPVSYTLCAAEVAEVFEVPLVYFLTPGTLETHQREFSGAMRRYWVYPWRNRYIWGATAAMLRALAIRLTGAGP